ncbi:DUF2637 domain-containing protein [Streptomyces shenzhenensis]|uniref:DUF2637 domain-containing protein n=1 Tax=Streptomyces shenzhenensis TaxID=943815 RepID=A0A3M0IVW2_9ACTN|nr:DUF2637 domain-containing protein [Streptomyces shenzhenensis]RMB86366.1 DUF2637 domain-containing protein [Streptomyces shenzhenensis]
MDGNYDEAGLYNRHYALRTDPDTLTQPAYDTVSLQSQQSWNPPAPEATAHGWDLDDELARMLSTAAAAGPVARVPRMTRRPPRRSGRRRLRTESHFLDGGQRVTHVTVLIVAITLCAASMLGWSVSYSYGQLRTIALSVLPTNLAQWWPLTVYGPWFVAALSILRATVQRRSARRSWGVILAASAMAVALCVSHSSRSLLSYVMLGIPPITALVCFWELVGQVSTRFRPRHAAHAQRNSKA